MNRSKKTKTLEANFDLYLGLCARMPLICSYRLLRVSNKQKTHNLLWQLPSCSLSLSLSLSLKLIAHKYAGLCAMRS